MRYECGISLRARYDVLPSITATEPESTGGWLGDANVSQE